MFPVLVGLVKSARHEQLPTAACQRSKPTLKIMSLAETGTAAPVMESDALRLLLTSDVTAMRSSWHFAAIIQFCRMFAPSLKLRGFPADLLESAMLDPDDHRVFLGELLFKLLRPDASQGFSEGDAAGWEQLLKRKVNAQWADAFDDNPLATQDFYDVVPMTRVRCVKVFEAACAFRSWQSYF